MNVTGVLASQGILFFTVTFQHEQIINDIYGRHIRGFQRHLEKMFEPKVGLELQTLL